MAGGGFCVTKGVQRVRKIASVDRSAKALANRRNRRAVRAGLRSRGEDALLTPKLYTDWDVI
jgi:hypothetical protein